MDLEVGHHGTQFFRDRLADHRFTRKSIKLILVDLTKKEDLTQADLNIITRHWIFLLFGAFLAPTSKCRLCLGVLKYLEELDQVWKYNWSECILPGVMSRINQCHDHVTKREVEGAKATVYLTKCAMTLQKSDAWTELVYQKWIRMYLFYT